MIVDCNLAVRVVLSFLLCAVDQFEKARCLARLQTLSLGHVKWEDLICSFRGYLTNFMALESHHVTVMCCVVSHTKNKLRSLNFEASVSFRKWWKFAYKNGVRGDRIKWCSNTRAVKNICLVYLSITPPDLSMMLVLTYSVDPLPLTFLTFFPVFSDNHP